MKPVNQRLAGGIMLLFVWALLLFIEKITKKGVITEFSLICIGIIVMPVILFLSGKLSKGYNETDENDDGVFLGMGILLLLLDLYFVIVA